MISFASPVLVDYVYVCAEMLDISGCGGHVKVLLCENFTVVLPCPPPPPHTKAVAF